MTHLPPLAIDAVVPCLLRALAPVPLLPTTSVAEAAVVTVEAGATVSNVVVIVVVDARTVAVVRLWLAPKDVQ